MTSICSVMELLQGQGQTPTAGWCETWVALWLAILVLTLLT